MRLSKSIKTETKKHKILSSAIKILNLKEYHECPVDEIAKSAGVAKGTVYLYFKNKEEIYFSVFFSIIDQIKELVKDITKQKLPATKQLYLIMKALFDFTSKYKKLFLALKQEMKPTREKLRNVLRKKIEELINEINVIIIKGIKENKIKNFPPHLLSAIFLSLTSVFIHSKIQSEKISTEESLKLIFNVLLTGIKK